MQINASKAAPVTPPTTAAPDVAESWQNPAAAAALRISSQMLTQVRAGIESNFDSIQRVRAFSTNLTTANSIFDDATASLQSDGSDMNDQFIPLIARASDNVAAVASRLASKEITDTWRDERESLLEAVKGATVIADNVGQQLDPRSL